MGKLKQEAEYYADTIRDRIHEVASDHWWNFQDQIEDAKTELKNEILAELEEWFPSESFKDVSAMEIIELIDDQDILDIVDDAVYSEWDV